MKITFLGIGGLVAAGIDPSEQWLLAVSHSGRGVFRTLDWALVARDRALAYPENGIAVGIGPIEGVRIPVAELNSDLGILIQCRNGEVTLRCESSGIAVEANGTRARAVHE